MGLFFMIMILAAGMTYHCVVMSVSWECFAALTRPGLPLWEVTEPAGGEPARGLPPAGWIRVGQVCGLVTGDRALVLMLSSPWSMAEPGVWYVEHHLRTSPLLVRVRIEPDRLLGTITMPLAMLVIPALILSWIVIFFACKAQLSVGSILFFLVMLAIVIGMRAIIEHVIFTRYTRQYLRELSQWLRDLPSDCQVVAASR